MGVTKVVEIQAYITLYIVWPSVGSENPNEFALVKVQVFYFFFFFYFKETMIQFRFCFP